MGGGAGCAVCTRGECSVSRIPVLFSALLAISTGAAAQSSAVLKGEPVTFSGCVMQGTHPDSFLLTSVQRTDGLVRDPNTIFWLDSSTQLIGHAGQLVEISGLVSKVDDAMVKVKIDPAKPVDTRIEVAHGVDTVKADVDLKPVGTSGYTQIEQPRTAVKLKVRWLKVLASSC
jgi:hypothetical protein